MAMATREDGGGSVSVSGRLNQVKVRQVKTSNLEHTRS